MWFFGLEFKLEAAAAGACALCACATHAGAAFVLWALLLSLLAAAKVFEPLAADLTRTGSAFLSEDPLK